jgi:hypothetical protein
MAAGAWQIYNKAKKKIGNGTIKLGAGGTPMRIALVQSGSNYATLTMSLWGSVTSQVASGNGYSTSGKALSAEAWTEGASAKQYKFDASDVVWTATGGTIPNIKAAVIFLSGGAAGSCQLLCYSSLTSAQFTLGSGNTLTIQMNAAGIFTMT